MNCQYNLNQFSTYTSTKIRRALIFFLIVCGCSTYASTSMVQDECMEQYQRFYLGSFDDNLDIFDDYDSPCTWRKQEGQLTKPISSDAMQQMIRVVSVFAERSIADVDQSISAAEQIDSDRLETHISEAGSWTLHSSIDTQGIDSLRSVREHMVAQQERLVQISERYNPHAEPPSEEPALNAYLERQAEEITAVHEAVGWFVDGRFYALDWIVDVSADALFSELASIQSDGQKVCKDIVESVIDERSKDGQEVDLLSIVLQTRSQFADQEREVIDRIIDTHKETAEQMEGSLGRVASDFQQLLDGTPAEWLETLMYPGLYEPIQTALTRPGYRPESGGYAIDKYIPIGPPHHFQSLKVYFHIPEVVGSEFLPISVEDATGKIVHEIDSNGYPIRDPQWLASVMHRALISMDWSIELPLISAFYHKDPKIDDGWPEYPRYHVNALPEEPRVQIWGDGVPDMGKSEWAGLIPQSVVEEHAINGQWIVMAVYGQKILNEGDQPPWIRKPLKDHLLEYSILHTATFSQDIVFGSEDPEWRELWRSLHDRNENRKDVGKSVLGIENADVYIIGVRLDPVAAGPYEFWIDDLRVSWTLPEATNFADTHFVRAVGGGTVGEHGWFERDQWVKYDRISNLFLHDLFYVEIEVQHEDMYTRQIGFDLFTTSEGGTPEPVEYEQPLFAYLVNNSTGLYRSPPIRMNSPNAKAASRSMGSYSEYGVPLKPGDRIAARVLPHDFARQGALAVARVHKTPSDVGAFWNGAVVEAARIAEVELPGPLSTISTQDLKSQVLDRAWTTVDSTPFVQFGGREVKLNVGDLASMLLIRDQFIRSMEETLPRLQGMRDKIKANPTMGRNIWAILRDDAQRSNSPLGDLEVLGWDPVRKTSIGAGVVPFRNAYDHDWLDQTFGGFTSHQLQWQSDSALFVFNAYVSAAEDSLQYAKDLDVTEAKPLLQLTSIGMHGLIDRLNPNLLQLVEDQDLYKQIGIGFRWEYSITGREYLSNIGGLGREFLDNETHVEGINAATALVSAVVAIVLPEVYIAQMISTGLSVGSALMTMTHSIPEFFGREADFQFAIGAYVVVGDERYITAKLRRMPAWALAIEIAGGALDVTANVSKLLHAQDAWTLMRSDVEIAKIFSESPQTFASLNRPQQMSALTRLAQLSKVQETGQTLTNLELSIVKRGMRMMEDMETAIDTIPPRYINTEVRGLAETTIMRHGQPHYVAPALIAEVRQTAEGFATTRIPDRFVTQEITMVSGNRRLLSLTPNENWGPFMVGDHVGRGVVCEVYALGEGAQATVLKVTRDLSSAQEDIARVLHCRDMIQGVVGQLAITDSGFVGKAGYLVQQRIPKNGTLLKAVRGTLASDTIPTTLAESERFKRVIGVVLPDGSAGPMLREQTHAICELYKKLIAKDIVWFDGHLGNLALIESEGKLVAQVVDQDFMWRWQGGKGFLQGPVGQSQGGVLGMLYLFDEPYIQLRLQSMIGHQPPSGAARMIFDGKHIYPDAEFFMYKQLERFGYINYVRGKGWVDGAMKLKHVKEIFPNIDNARFVDPDLGKLLQQSSIIQLQEIHPFSFAIMDSVNFSTTNRSSAHPTQWHAVA